MMNEQRAFWISGLGSLAVVLLLASALWARSRPPETSHLALATTGASAPNLAEPVATESALREELRVAYSNLDSAYREIEQLRSDRDDHEDGEERAEGYERENEERR